MSHTDKPRTARPTRSTKYRIYRRSKYRFPTTFGKEGRAGDPAAKRDVEGTLGRSLRDGTATAHTRSQWVWQEPRSAC